MAFHKGADGENPERVMVGVGVLEVQAEEGHDESAPIVMTDHIFLEDTIDGGATAWMSTLSTDPHAQPIPRWSGWPNTSKKLDPSWPTPKPVAVDGAPSSIPLYCRCKGVDLILRRGKYKSNKAPPLSSAGGPALNEKEPDALPWFVEPQSHKVIATFDACDSCRISLAGLEIMNWTFAEMKNIEFADSSDSVAGKSSSGFPMNTFDLKADVQSKPEDKDPRLGTLTMYASSEDVQRYFCSRCSASLFYAADDRPDMINVAVGVLDSPDGARAESLLEWGYGNVGWPEDAKGWRKDVADAVKRNSETFRVEHDIPKAWLRVAKEEMEAAKALAQAQAEALA